MNHCPACNKTITDTQLMCEDHWEMVPDHLREPIRKLKKNRGSPEWTKAVNTAIEQVRYQVAQEKELDDYVRGYR